MGAEYRDRINEFWDFLENEGFKIQRIYPELHDGKVIMSDYLSRYEFMNDCEHGDYYAYRA